MLKTIVAAGIVVALLYAVAYRMRRTSMFFPEKFPSGMWDARALRIQPSDHTFEASDGVALHGWLFKAASSSAPLIVWFHGNGGNITSRAETAAGLAERGVSVFLFDWRGYGRSGGNATESGLYRDALAAYDYAARSIGAERIVAYGESLGGPYAAYVARHRKVRCVVIENSFPSLRDLGNALYAPIPVGWTAPWAMPATRWLNEANVPVLIMHGRRDTVIPFRLGQALYDGLNVPKEMLVSDTADHSEIPSVEGARYYETVARFIGKHAH